MPQNETQSQHSYDREILVFPAGQDAIKSVVVAASAIPTLASAITGKSDVKGLLAGTPLEAIPGDSQGRVRKFTSGTIIGILGTTLIFNNEASVDANYDVVADAPFHGCVFRKDRIVGFNAAETDLKADLPTCSWL